jgi:hypothetical protein
MMVMLVDVSVNGLDVQKPMYKSIKKVENDKKNWQRQDCIRLSRQPTRRAREE